MITHAQQPAPLPSPFGRRRSAHPWLLAAAIGQLVLTYLAGFGYAVVGIGVGTCSGTDGSGACGKVLDSYDLAGYALALNAAVGVLTVAVARSTHPPVVHRVLAAAIAVSLILGVAAGTALW